MKVTEIKQQEKRKDRYSIFIDDKYSFALSESGLLSAGLKVGQELSKNELEAIKKDAAVDKGVYRALDLISRRPRSRWEIEDYLNRKKYDPEQIATMLQIIEKKGYINDEDFARRWVDSRRLLKPISRRKLRLELRQKRVESEIIDDVLENGGLDEKEILKELIAKKRRQAKYQDEQKLIAYLARQGFNYSDIKEVLSEQ